MEEQKENTCGNCKYYVRYYTKRNTCYHASFYGYCTIVKNTKKSKEKGTWNPACTLWESASLLQAERVASIKSELRSMAKSLREISSILKEEE